jgi:DNA-binding NarL/FixJ family response regulator
MAEVRVLIIEDHAIVGSGFGAALDGFDDIVVAGIATTLGAARDRLKSGDVDVVLADIDLGDYDTLELPVEIGPGGPPVLFLTGHRDPALIRAAIDGGGAGYLSKEATLDEVVSAIRIVAGGGTAFSRHTLSRARSALTAPTEREREVLGGVVAGEPNKVIAGRLGVGERTIESHIRRLFDRYRVESRTQLAVLALSERWIRDSKGRKG